MQRFLSRCLGTIPVMLGISVLVFFGMRLTPGDPVDIMTGQMAISDEQREQIRAEHVPAGVVTGDLRIVDAEGDGPALHRDGLDPREAVHASVLLIRWRRWPSRLLEVVET